MKLSFYTYLLCIFGIAAALMAGFEVVRWHNKMGCLPRDGQAPAGYWLDACNSSDVGDLSRDDTWYDLEPSVAPGVRKADVLFFGGSRMLYAASRGDADQWFAKRGWPFYILAYEGDEQSGWGIKLMHKFRPHPKVVIVDVNRFFTNGYSVPAQTIFANEAKERKNALAIHEFFDRMTPLCKRFSSLCGRTQAVYRSKQDGHTIFYAAGRENAYPLHAPPPGNKGDFGPFGPDKIDLVEKNANAFIAATGVPRQCVIMTALPNEMSDNSQAIAVAKRTGAVFVSPEVGNLSTLDYSHLTTDSSKIWTTALLNQAETIMRSCISNATTH
jgi:hypothetical protein